GTLVALAGFEFKVSSGASTFMDFTGVETLTVGADGKIMTNDLVLSSLGVLQGLTKLTPGDPGSALGYAWDASDVLIGLGSDLAAGDSRVITYSSTVSTFSRADCSLADESICLVAYSAFGDPVGRGGGVNDASFGGFGASLLGAFSPFGASPGITGVGFTPTTFATPTFENGLLTFNTNGAGVPEPATWMSLIAGFGLLGAALRRRRVVAYN
ncbi:MAG TPA: PEPxxWA-CTERM sorting domain-containing protein, partial [Phenylobacterium sp.]|nr:PEPxxWA-CTERM sorting domain-containing protein [Phenylobacterium sp.]